MSPLMYIIRRSIVNAIKGLTKKPAILVLYILLAVMFVGMIVLIFVMPQGSMGAKDPALFRTIMAAVSIVVYYFSLRQGIEKGGSFFRSADVNLVFTGPIRPNDALLYGFIKQMGTMALVLFVAVFQVPNLKNNFALQPYGLWIVLLAVGLYGLSYPLFGMALYAFTSKSQARKRLANGILNGALALVLLAFVWNLYDTRDLLRGAYALLDSPVIAWVPVVGWMKNIAAGAVDGIGAPFLLSLGAMVALIGLSVLALYRLNLDYYEEVLGATEYKESVIAAKKEGTSMQLGTKARRKVKQGLFGEGAMALFGKNIVELRKSSFVLFFDRTTMIVAISALAFRFLMPKDLGYGMLVILAFAVYMLFLLQMQGRWPMELGRHFIFTLPASPSQKLFWVTASDHIKNLIDGLALFVIAGVSLKAMGMYAGLPIALILACTVTYALLGAVFVYGDVMARRLFGGVHSKPLLVFLKLFLIGFLLTPGITLAIIASVLTHLELLAVAAFGLWALVAAAAVFAISAGIFKNIEAGA